MTLTRAIVYGRGVLALEILGRPRRALARAAAAPRLDRSLAAVALAGAALAVLEVLATLVVRGAPAGLILSALVPVLLVLYWLLDAWLVDAGAGLSGRRGRRRRYLAVSGFAFVALVGYGVLAIVEAVASRWIGEAAATAAGWLTLPLLGWFLTLMVIAITTVYELPALNAFALALLPLAAIAAALLLALLVLSVLHAVSAI